MSGIEGLAVFVVEDEALVVVNLEDMLLDLGCTVIGPAMRMEAAMAMLEDAARADVALLDVNLGGTPVFTLAEALRDRGVKLIFATGYGRGGLPAEWQANVVLQKPYTLEEVAAGLAAATSRGVA
jgi:CheY-like chemotaxis protein